MNDIYFHMQFDSCLQLLHILGHRISLSLCSAGLKLHHRTIQRNIASNIIQVLSLSKSVKSFKNDRMFLILTLICVRKMSISYEEYMFSVFQFTSKKLFEKTLNFRLKFSFIAFRITLRTSSVFRLSISSLNFD